MATRWFRPYAVSADLTDLLDCRYVAASAGHHDLLPDGCMDLVWTAERGAMLCGPDTAAWSFDLPPGLEMAGVRFRPGAASGIVGADAASLVDRRVALADLLGARTARLLAEQLAEADAWRRLRLVEDLVRRRRRDADPAIAVAEVVASDPSVGVGRLAEHAGVSSRQLRRRFDRTIGYGPAFFARVVRLQRFAKAAVAHPELGLAELAASAGYADQSHLARDARVIAGRTPRDLVGGLGRSSLAVDVRSVQDARTDEAARWAA